MMIVYCDGIIMTMSLPEITVPKTCYYVIHENVNPKNTVIEEWICIKYANINE